jgi:hypothetical protein
MDFYLPDSQDQIDPRFDFMEEEHPPFHVRQRDDAYAHEVLDDARCDGILVSKAIVDGLSGTSGRYTVAQRHRMYRIGVKRFFRLDAAMKTLGDCGGFSYVGEEVPPINPQEAIDFYEGCQFDEGVSVDHVILGYRSDRQPSLFDEAEASWAERQRITLDYAAEFHRLATAQGCRFHPVGAAQGWSPSSYRDSVAALQRMGYSRIAMGGMVPLKTPQILEVLQTVAEVRHPTTRLHLLGVTRTDSVHLFAALGVTSFDSTSPFRQAFMDDRDNYHWHGEHYTAIRVPPVGGNAKLKRRIKAGTVDQNTALRLEAECLRRLREFDAGRSDDVEAVLDVLAEYHELFDQRDRVGVYRRTLEDQPWKRCSCGICAKAGIEVAIFRGTERNKRRGFHNIAIFADDLARRLSHSDQTDGAVHA